MLDVAEQLVHVQYINHNQIQEQPDLKEIIPNFETMTESEQKLFQD